MFLIKDFAKICNKIFLKNEKRKKKNKKKKENEQSYYLFVLFTLKSIFLEILS